ncbi:SDR family NAD(P)-dependent oxidoreductase [Nocardiopsis potens]|uniref:SDR family NAD(P)-dependent oxidoreductase n=1 Tax=Nocardiopsis potens TaxID=1246458 RepID=UPI000348D3BD|nr:SDR family NAD(P)-dependent oxidoreductase [Nocardiopsis potens]
MARTPRNTHRTPEAPGEPVPWDPAGLPDQSGRTMVVTGATSGIGYFAAEQLAGAGARVVLAGRSPERLRTAEAAIRSQVPGASLDRLVVDLAEASSVAAASSALAGLDRIDGLLLNGGSMAMKAAETTRDGLPMQLGTHLVANVALTAGALPALARTGERSGVPARIAHTSTGYVDLLRRPVTDPLRTSRIGVVAYTRAKALTEVFGAELHRRLRAAEAPVLSLVVRPGIGTDARTPHRPGIRDRTVPLRRNPYTPWAQGKDAAAWPAVRALTDPRAQGGEFYAPENGVRGLPVRFEPRWTSPPDLVDGLWRRFEELAGVAVPVPAAARPD